MVIRMLGEMHLCGQFEVETALIAGLDISNSFGATRVRIVIAR